MKTEQLVVASSGGVNDARPQNELIIGNDIIYIPDHQYSGNELTTLIIGNKVEHIGIGAFSGNKFKTLIIPDSVKKIGICAFSRGLFKTITIPNSVERIGIGAFSYGDLQEIVCDEGCIVDQNASVAIRNAFGHSRWTRTLKDGRAIYSVKS